MRKTPGIILLLLAQPSAFALDCSRAPDINYSNSGAANYGSWCKACGGTFINAGGNVSCKRGPNWGGQAGAPAAPPADPMMGFMGAMMGGMQQLQADQERRDAEAAGERQARQQADQEAWRQNQLKMIAEKQRLLDENHTRLAGLLREIGTNPNGPDKPNGNPIINCAELKQDHDNFARGLAVQKEAVNRTENLLKEAEAQHLKDKDAELDAQFWAGVDILKNISTNAARNVQEINRTVDELRAKKLITIQEQRRWEKLFTGLNAFSDFIRKTDKSYKAADKFARKREICGEADSYTEVLKDTAVFVRDSGIADLLAKKGIKAGGDLALSKGLGRMGLPFMKALGGPFFAFSYSAGKTAIELAATTASSENSAWDANKARANLQQLQQEHNRLDGKVADMEILYSENCSGILGIPGKKM